MWHGNEVRCPCGEGSGQKTMSRSWSWEKFFKWCETLSSVHSWYNEWFGSEDKEVLTFFLFATKGRQEVLIYPVSDCEVPPSAVKSITATMAIPILKRDTGMVVVARWITSIYLAKPEKKETSTKLNLETWRSICNS